MIDTFLGLPDTVQLGWVLIALSLIVLIVAALYRARTNYRVRRAAARASLIHSIRSHPAGSRNVIIPMERTRHIDRAGFDWTSDKL
jgi:hypothetical protein